MYWKAIIMTVMMSLILGGTAFAQQERNQDGGFLGIGGDQEQQQQTFTGVVDQIEDDYVLIVGDRAYKLDIDDEQLVRSMILGQEVQVRGTMDDDTIQAETVSRAGEMQEQPGMEQPRGDIGAEQPRPGQEGNQTGSSW
jgi:hypothetical protein